MKEINFSDDEDLSKSNKNNITNNIRDSVNKESINEYIVHLLQIIKGKSNDKLQEVKKIKINPKNLKTIKVLKYYIIDKFYKKSKLCPCLLVISIPFEDGYYYSEVNESPNKSLTECFPDDKNIYININLDIKCDCGFSKLDSLSKREIYDMYIERINKLKKLLVINNVEKCDHIKELQDINKEILNSYDRQIYDKQIESNYCAKIKSNFNLNTNI